MNNAIEVKIQNQILRSKSLLTYSGCNSTRIATNANILANTKQVVTAPKLHSKTKHMPAIPRHVNHPNAGVSIKCLFQSPSWSRWRAIAKPGRNASSRPRAICLAMCSSLQTYLRRIINHVLLAQVWLKSSYFQKNTGFLISPREKILILFALSPTK